MKAIAYINTCNQCQLKFETPWAKARYCSDECKAKATKLQQRQKHLRRKARETSDPELRNKYLRLASINDFIEECSWCQRDFNTRGKRIKYCCSYCKKEAQLEQSRKSHGSTTKQECRKCKKNI